MKKTDNVRKIVDELMEPLSEGYPANIEAERRRVTAIIERAFSPPMAYCRACGEVRERYAGGLCRMHYNRRWRALQKKMIPRKNGKSRHARIQNTNFKTGTEWSAL